jgi:hypothetical protein
MREKEKPLEITNKYSQKIINLLLRKQSDDKLYYISKSIDMQQGTFRRKLENPNGWSEIHVINGVLDYFNISYDELFKGRNPDDTDLKEKINNLKEIIRKQNDLIDTFKRVMQAIRNLSEEAFQKFSSKELVELMWKTMNEKVEYVAQNKKSISN